ncbi:MAG: hypothetical protein U9R48_05905 [Chloroflexota bacterium]|nr:hypothetical protein [Chloroflexota bacterium]
MTKDRFWFFLITLGALFPLVACGSKATPTTEMGPTTEVTATKSTEVEATPTSAEARPTLAPEGEDEVEPNNGPGQATEISMGQFAGILGEDDQDWYKFEVPNGHLLNVAFTPDEDAESMTVSLLDPDQDEIWYEGGIGPTVTKQVSKLMSSSSGGTYYVGVQYGTGGYNLELSSQSQNDADSGGDAGDEVVDALEVESDRVLSGRIGDFDEKDWYKFDVANGHLLNVAFTPDKDAESMTVSLLDPDQNEIWYEGGIGPTVTKQVSKLMSSSSGGVYYVGVQYGNGGYSLELSSQSQNDADSGGDAGDEEVDALEVGTDLTFSGQIGDFDEEDWYWFIPKVGQTVNFSPDEDAESMTVSLLDPDQNEIWYEGSIGPGMTKTFEFGQDVLSGFEGERYYIRVVYGSGSYSVEIK